MRHLSKEPSPVPATLSDLESRFWYCKPKSSISEIISLAVRHLEMNRKSYVGCRDQSEGQFKVTGSHRYLVSSAI